MLEYIFFEAKFRGRFTDRLEMMQVDYELAGAGEELLVLIDENIEGALETLVESLYDEIMNDQAASINHQESPDDATHVVGVQYSAPSGEIYHVRLPPELVNRISRCLSAGELQHLVQTVADGVLKQDNRSLCNQLEP